MALAGAGHVRIGEMGVREHALMDCVHALSRHPMSTHWFPTSGEPVGLDGVSPLRTAIDIGGGEIGERSASASVHHLVPSATLCAALFERPEMVVVISSYKKLSKW